MILLVWLSVLAGACHHVYGKDGSIVRLSIPIHGSKPLRVGLLRHLAKLAKIFDEDLW